jgi:hypothetical protein
MLAAAIRRQDIRQGCDGRAPHAICRVSPQADPGPLALLKLIHHPERNDLNDAGERVAHQPEQGAHMLYFFGKAPPELG